MQEIYLDNAATTKCHPGAATLALELMTGDYGNPSSLHAKGVGAQLRLDMARGQLAGALGCDMEEVTFTGSGTEANNLAILGAATVLRRKGNGIVAMSAMHQSALKPLEKLAAQGFWVTLIPPKSDGNTDIDALSDAITGDTILLVCDFVNSEVGAVTPLERLSRLARRKNKDIHIHCDSVQALGKVRFSARSLGIDSMSVSAHKVFAPKGCGALYLRRGAKTRPLLFGGGQERGLRPGTENTPAICAFGYTAELVTHDFATRYSHVADVYEYFVNKVAKMPEVCRNSPDDSTPYICNIALPGFKSEPMLHFLAGYGVYLSSGSACSKGAASHVLTAMGLPKPRIDGALRVSLSPEITKGDIDKFLLALQSGINTLARSSK